MTDSLAALADRIAAARRGRTVLDFLAGATAGMSEEDAYRLQFMVHDRLCEGGRDRIAGWKVAAALPAMYEPIGLKGPAFAAIFQSGLRGAEARFEKGWPIKAGVECEIVARMSADAWARPAPYDAASIAPLVGALHCGMEVVENRYGDVSKLDGKGRVADDFLQAACLVGPEIAGWRSMDLAAVQGSSTFEGKTLGAGPGANVMGGALVSLAWLANSLIAHGKKLRAGDLILTGSVHPPAFLPGPGTARSEFVGLGGVSATFE